eukprot:g15831.t1
MKSAASGGFRDRGGEGLGATSSSKVSSAAAGGGKPDTSRTQSETTSGKSPRSIVVGTSSAGGVLPAGSPRGGTTSAPAAAAAARYIVEGGASPSVGSPGANSPVGAAANVPGAEEQAGEIETDPKAQASSAKAGKEGEHSATPPAAGSQEQGNEQIPSELPARNIPTEAATGSVRPSSRGGAGVSLFSNRDHFTQLRHGFTQYGQSVSKVREVMFESKETLSEVLCIWLGTDQLVIPDVDAVLESVEMATESSIFVGDFFAAVLLKHYLAISKLPLAETQRDRTAVAVRKYLHFNFMNLFKPELAGGRRTIGAR